MDEMHDTNYFEDWTHFDLKRHSTQDRRPGDFDTNQWSSFLGSIKGVRHSGSPSFFNEIQRNISELGAILRSGLNLIYLIEASLYLSTECSPKKPL